MTRHVKWKEIASELIYGEWGEERIGVSNFIKSSSDSRLTICLLLDIAESLRVLRCENFKDIPNRLSRIALNTRKKKRRIKP